MDRIWHFLAGRSVDLADRIEAAIRIGVTRLPAFPLIGRLRADAGRELVLPDIQYRIGYFVQDGRILIASVRSTKEGA